MSPKDFFPGSAHSCKAELDLLVEDLHRRPDILSYIAHVKPGKYYCVSPSFETLTGYAAAVIESEGVDFFPKRVDPQTILSVMEAQAKIFGDALKPDYDQSETNLCEMSMSLRLPDGSLRAFIGLMSPIQYLESGEIELALCTGFVKGDDEDERRKEVESILGKIKSLYWQVYAPRRVSNNKKKVVELVIQTNPKHTLTDKELEVLGRLVNGSTSKDVAVALSISENTVETHRKNMLAKFGARNTAELVKKATRLYWLE